MKELISNKIAAIGAILCLKSVVLFSQGDSIPYQTYSDKVVLYSDFGYSTAPFSIKYPFTPDIRRIKYRNNFNAILGFGMCYKWFSVRLGFALAETEKNVAKHGKTSALNLGTDFTIKKTFWDLEFRRYEGFVIKKAYRWDENYSKSNPNIISPHVISSTLSINSWYFHNKHFKMEAVRGKTAHFIRKVHTWYIKSTFNGYGISNTSTLIPHNLIDTLNTKTSATSFAAVDLGLIPGYAYADRINNWQFTGLLGLGAVIQSKNYNTENYARNFLGIAPRFDIRLIGGYSVPKFFCFLSTDFDNKTIRFDPMRIRQTFYSIKLIVGVRIHQTKNKTKKKRK